MDLKTAWEAEDACAKRGHECGRGHGQGYSDGTALAKPTKATVPKWVPPPLLKDFLAGNNIEQDVVEGKEASQGSGGEGSNNSTGDEGWEQ